MQLNLSTSYLQKAYLRTNVHDYSQPLKQEEIKDTKKEDLEFTKGKKCCELAVLWRDTFFSKSYHLNYNPSLLFSSVFFQIQRKRKSLADNSPKGL